MTATDTDTDQALEILSAIRTSRRRRVLGVILGFALGAAAGVAGWLTWENLDDGPADSAEVTVELSTASVELRDLATFVEFDGTLGFSQSQGVVAGLSGTVTAIADSGDKLSRGAVIYEVDTQPIVLLYGEFPTWRDLDTDSEDGRDILQLEANLWALGYTVDIDDGKGAYLTVDGNYDWATALAVQLWETDLGLEDPDGDFDSDLVLYLPGEIRVDDPTPLGTVSRSGTAILTATVSLEVLDQVDAELAVVSGQTLFSTEQVTLEVATDEQDEFTQNKEVEIELSDGRFARGIVAEVSEVARRVGNGPNAQLLIDVEIEVTKIPDGGLLEGPVIIRLIDEAAFGVTAVPVRALVALAEGGYAVEIRSNGTDRLTGIEIGLFADGWVEVIGDLKPGDEVLVP